MKGISLKTKSIVMIILFALFLSVIAIFISYSVYSKTMNDHYKTSARNIAYAAASQMDGDKINEYIKKLDALDKDSGNYKEELQYIKDEEYYSMLDTLFDLKESLNALYLYVEKITPNNVVYIMDADKEGSSCELGETFPIYGNNARYIETLKDGVPAFISKTKKFGWLCSAGAPILDSSGNVVAVAFTDISMNNIMDDRYQFLMYLLISLVAATIFASVIIIVYINRSVVTPVNKLSYAAGKFVSDKDNNEDDNVTAISRLDIHTGDEIQKLSDAIKTMEKDINNYIKNLTAVTAEKERIGAELNIATRIQASMLPCISPSFPKREEFDICAMMQPAKEVGGDFYDFFLIDRDHLAVVIADVSGKGVPAALFMVITKTLIKNQMQAGNTPEEVFTCVNAQLCENNEASMFVTGWMGVLEISTGKFTFVNAGHNPPLIKRREQCFEYLKSNAGFVLAGMEGIHYRQNEMRLEPGDELYLYTDGITEATNAQNELYGEYRLQEVLNHNMDTAPSLLLSAVKTDIDNFVKDAPQFDDVTMLILKIRGRGNE